MKLEIAKIRKFLMQWVFPPSWIRIVCFLLSRIVRCSSSILQYKRKSHRFYVLGNEPSLKKDIEKY